MIRLPHQQMEAASTASHVRDVTRQLHRWLFLVLLLGVVATATVLAFGREIYDLYVWEFVAPQLEQELGFRIGRVKVIGETGHYHVPGIVAVQPNSAFHRAGFQPGDIPIGYVHGFVGFYRQLHSSRGEQTTIRILRPEDAGEWTKARQRIVAIPPR